MSRIIWTPSSRIAEPHAAGLKIAYAFPNMRNAMGAPTITAVSGYPSPVPNGIRTGNAGFQLPPSAFSAGKLTIICRFFRHDYVEGNSHFLTADSFSDGNRNFQFRLSSDSLEFIGFVGGAANSVSGAFSTAYREIPLVCAVTHDGTTTTLLGLSGGAFSTLYSGTGVGSPINTTAAYVGVGVGWASASTAYDVTRSTTTSHLLAWDRALPIDLVKQIMLDPAVVIRGRSRRAIYIPSAGGGGATIAADSGTYALTGTAVTLQANRKLAADSGSYTLTGSDVSLRVGRKLAADSGTYSLSGTDVAFKRGYALSAASGTYTLNGTDVSLKANRKLAADSGTYSLTGTNVALTYSPAGSYSLTAESGSYTLSGTSATLRVNRKLVADSGTYTLTDTAATVAKGYRLTTDSGTYTLTGSAVAFARTYRLVAESGSYVLAGSNVALTWSGAPVVIPDPGTGGGGSRRVIISERKVRDEVDEWLKRKQEAEILKRIQREDEEICLIMALLAA